jgi:predicted alpha-1,6-mannanase (GH76 family)
MAASQVDRRPLPLRKRPSRLALAVVPALLGVAALAAWLLTGGAALGQTPDPAPSSSPAAASPAESPASPAPASASASPAPAVPALSSPVASRGVTAAQADAAINAFDRAFYLEQGGRGFFRKATGAGDYATFWRTAEMIELVEDAADRSGSPTYDHMVAELVRGVSHRFGGTWTRHRRYNDDVMWMVLAFERASRITGDSRLRDVARRNFDAVFARAWSSDFGGGLWWTTDRREKNICVNAPAAIAAVRLSRALHDGSYLRKAARLYAWTRAHLYDEATGAVYDHVTQDEGATAVDRSTYTYNQGTFAGAAGLLFRATGDGSYAREAHDAVGYARDGMTTGGVLTGEGDGGDGGGFKGIFARYAGDYLRHDPQRTFDDWLALNAGAAWSHRDARGLMGQDWTRRTTGGELHAFDASSAVVLLQQLRGR